MTKQRDFENVLYEVTESLALITSIERTGTTRFRSRHSPTCRLQSRAQPQTTQYV